VGLRVMLLAGGVGGRAVVRSRAGDELGKIPLFANLSAKQLAAVDRLVTTIEVRSGRELIRQGERGGEFIVVVDGEAEVRRDGEVIAVRGPGTFFGEMALLLDRPRNASVVARTAMTIDVIDRQDFRRLLDEFPDLHAPLLAAVAERLAELDESP
jgi:CRP-like cAMP-binding protein